MPTGPRPPLSKAQQAVRGRSKAKPREEAAAGAEGDEDGLPDNAAHKIDALREAAKAAGIKPGIIQALVNRVRAGDPNLMADVKRVTGKDLLDTLEDRLSLVLHYLDPLAVSQASLKDLTIATGILIDKQLLLKGLPTQIIDFTSRQQLQVLAPRLLAEAKRRGITLDGSAQRVPEAPLPVHVVTPQ